MARLEIKKILAKLADYAATAIIAAAALWCAYQGSRIFLFDTFVIPTRSMEPTLIPGDRIVVNKTLYGARIYRDLHFSRQGVRLQCWRTNGLRDIRRGDVVVFNMPYHSDCDTIKFVINYVYCKRCIGLPGDSVSISGGFYANNNSTDTLGCADRQRTLAAMPDSIFQPEALRALPYDDHLPRWTIKNFGPLYIPRRGDCIVMTPATATHYRKLIEWERHCRLTIDWTRRRVLADGRPLAKHTFSHDYFFMAGDNAPDSRDSRYIGLIPDDYIIGIATIIKYSTDRNTGEIRWGRTLKRIK